MPDRGDSIATGWAPRHAQVSCTLLTQQGRGKEALEYFAIALRINPRSAEAHNNLGLALENQGRLGEAIAQYRAALESRPEFAVAAENLERALKVRKRP